MSIHPIINALRNERRRQGLTQREMARLAGTTQSAISEAESGTTDVRLSTLTRWAAALGKRVRLDDVGGVR